MAPLITSLVATSAFLTTQAFAGLVPRTNGPTAPSCSVPFTPYLYAGCYTDPGSPHALGFSPTGLNRQAMTIETCAAVCKGNGYRYAGVEYYGECYCGNSVQGVKTLDSACTFPCTGNKTQTCGGNNLISVYMDPTYPPSDEPDILAYTPEGCYTEGYNGRAVAWRQSQLSTTTMTTEVCLRGCRSQNFPLAATEYGGECYCGVVLGNGTVSAPATECNVKCNGDPTQICGGRSRINLYVNRDLFSTEPCSPFVLPPPIVKTSTTTSKTVTTSSTAAPDTISAVSTTSSDVSTTLSVEEPSLTTISEAESTTTIPDEQPTTAMPEEEPSTTTIPDADSATTTPAEESTTSESTSSFETTTAESTNAEPATSSSSSSSSSKPESTSISASSSSTPMTTSSPTVTKTSTTLSTACVSTVTSTSTCEYECGKWCSKPIPAFNDRPTCKTAVSECILQIADCYENAGWPASLQCAKFQSWCVLVEDYCGNSCGSGKCNKKECTSKNPPMGGETPTSTTVNVCSATTTKAITSTSSTAPVPTVSSICIRPNGPLGSGFSNGKCVGDIEPPALTCNNIANEFDAYPLKLYTDKESAKSPKFDKANAGQACKEACKVQYNSCVGTYAQSCKGKKQQDDQDSYESATDKCKHQYDECLEVNKQSSIGKRCTKFSKGWD